MKKFTSEMLLEAKREELLGFSFCLLPFPNQLPVAPTKQNQNVLLSITHFYTTWQSKMDLPGVNCCHLESQQRSLKILPTIYVGCYFKIPT